MLNSSLLLVEDNQDDEDFMLLALRKAGYPEVAVARDGANLGKCCARGFNDGPCRFREFPPEN